MMEIDIKKYEDRMRPLKDMWDKESAHGDADDILIEVLTELGYDELVRLWEIVPKWYA